MELKLIDGVILVSVCGEYLLVATKEARGKVSYVQRISEDYVFYWELVQKETEYEDSIRQICDRFDIPAEQAEANMMMFLRQLHEMGYLEVVEESEEE